MKCKNVRNVDVICQDTWNTFLEAQEWFGCVHADIQPNNLKQE